MAEYIERESAIAWFMPYAHEEKSIDADIVISDIKGMKAADVVPVRHGHWNAINQIAIGMSWKYRCNDCGCPQEYTHNYCPNCGARMDGGDCNDDVE